MAARRWVPLRAAWEAALYGRDGFYRRESPAAHFTTSAHTSAGFAEAVVELVRRLGLHTVVDVGAGAGRLLTDIHRRAPDLALVGVELRARPAGVPDAVGWEREPPQRCEGLLLANELLDNVPCDVVELDARGRCRVVDVDPATGDQRLGEPAPPDIVAWTRLWWPLSQTGDRAEVGLARELRWAQLCSASSHSLCVAVDYGHLGEARPHGGSLTSYRGGVQTPLCFDGGHDITAHVAFDSLAAAVGGTPRRQRDVLRELGVSGRRPALERATTDPEGYVRDLAAASEAAELTASGGLGDFYWLVSPRP